MAFIGKKYTLETVENIVEFLETLDIDEAIKNAATNIKPTVSLAQNGDGSYTIIFASDLINTEHSFKLGEPVDEVRADGTKLTSIYTLEGNVFTQEHIPNPGKKITIKGVFSAEDLNVEITKEESEIVLNARLVAV